MCRFGVLGDRAGGWRENYQKAGWQLDDMQKSSGNLKKAHLAVGGTVFLQHPCSSIRRLKARLSFCSTPPCSSIRRLNARLYFCSTPPMFLY